MAPALLYHTSSDGTAHYFPLLSLSPNFSSDAREKARSLCFTAHQHQRQSKRTTEREREKDTLLQAAFLLTQSSRGSLLAAVQLRYYSLPSTHTLEALTECWSTLCVSAAVFFFLPRTAAEAAAFGCCGKLPSILLSAVSFRELLRRAFGFFLPGSDNVDGDLIIIPAYYAAISM